MQELSIEQTNVIAEDPPIIKYLPCPDCQASVPVYESCAPWCDQCGWNLEPRRLPPPETFFERLYQSIGHKSSQRLFEQMMRGRSLEAALTPQTGLAYLLAACVHSVALAFLFLGIGLSVITLLGYGGVIIFALPCFLIAWLLVPKSPKLPAAPLPRDRFPTLYRITDRIAQTLGGSRVDGIVPGVHFNAGFGRFGWKRRRILLLGLPLFSILNAQEKVALLSHEIAHGVNGDPNRSLFIGTAVRSLAAWYEIVHPRNRWRVNAGPAHLFLLLINLISLPLAGAIWLVGYGLSHLLWRESQRAEYLADLLAAKLSGTDTQLTLLDKVHLDGVFRNSLVIAYLNQRGPSFFTDLRQRVAGVPPREFERIRRIEKLSDSRIDEIHPPTAHRIKFLKAHYVPEATVTLPSSELALLEQELIPLMERMQEQIFALDGNSFSSLFGVSW